MFTIYDEVPFTVRPTYFYTIRAALVGAIAGGIGSLLGNVAVSILHASQWDMAVISSMEGGGMLLAFFWGGFTARRRKMPFVFWSSVLSGSIFFVLSMVGTPTVFCVLVGLIGLVGSIGAPARAGIVSSNMPASVRGMIIGFTQRWSILVMVVVGIAGAEVIQNHSWTYRWILPAGGVFAIAAALIYLRIRVRGENRPVPAKDSGSFAVFRVLAKDKLFRTYMIDFFLFGFGNLLTGPIVLIVLRDDMHADFRQIQWTNVIIPAVLGLTTVGLWGRKLDKSDPVTMRAWMNVVWLVLPLCYYFAPRHPVLVGGFSIHPVVFIWIGAVVQGSVATGQGLIWMLGAMYFAKKEDVPLYQGVHIGLTGVRALTAPFVGPLIVESVFGGGLEARRSLFLVSTLMMVISALLLFKLSSRIKHELGGRMPGSAQR
jgi:MFS family permease